MGIRKWVYVCALWFAGAANVSASLLTLDNNNIRVDGIFVEGDFQITADAGLVNGGNLGLRTNLVNLGFANEFMETWNTLALFTVSRIDSARFTFDGLDVGGYFSGDAAWTFRGFLAGNEVFNAVDVNAQGALNFNWRGIDSFTIQSSRGSAASSFDNIRVSEFVPPAPAMAVTAMAATVPEPPMSAWLVVGSIILLRTARR